MCKLNLLAIWREGTHALGPGLRYCIWTQGCPFSCEKCTTPEGRVMRTNQLVDPVLLAEDIASVENITGITISGGEPFLQAEQLSVMLHEVRLLRPEIDVLVFTGYKVENLVWDHAKDLLSMVDLVIDGEYQDSLNNGLGLRGSTNQRFIFLTDRLLAYRDELENGKRKLEMHIEDKGIFTIGIPNHLKI